MELGADDSPSQPSSSTTAELAALFPDDGKEVERAMAMMMTKDEKRSGLSCARRRSARTGLVIVVGRRVLQVAKREVESYLVLGSEEEGEEGHDHEMGEDGGVWLTTMADPAPIEAYLQRRGRPATDRTGRGWALQVVARTRTTYECPPSNRLEHKFLVQFEGSMPDGKDVVAKVFVSQLTYKAQLLVAEMEGRRQASKAKSTSRGKSTSEEERGRAAAEARPLEAARAQDRAARWAHASGLPEAPGRS